MIEKVRARGKARYKVRYRDLGGRKTSRTFDTEAEAKIFEGQIAQAKRGVIEMPKAQISNLTLDQFGAEYRDKYLRIELAASTQLVYGRLWNLHVGPRIGHLPLSAIDVAVVQRFKADLLNDGVGDAAVAKTLSVLSGVLGKAVEWQRMADNPVRAVKKPTQKRARKIIAMPADQISELADLMSTDQGRSLVGLVGFAGLRPGEALALTGADLAGGQISVDKAISLGVEKDTKTHRDRVVPILDPLGDLLGEVSDGPLFRRADGQPWLDSDYRNWRKRVFKPAVRILGVDPAAIEFASLGGQDAPSGEWANFRPYDLRHSFASRLLMEDWAPIEVAEIMGHSPQMLMSTYAHAIAVRRLRKHVSV